MFIERDDWADFQKEMEEKRAAMPAAAIAPWIHPGQIPGHPWASQPNAIGPSFNRGRSGCAAEAERCARLAEEASSEAGARHALREAFKSGYEAAWLRVWAVLSENGLASNVFDRGASETLAAACSGFEPREALEFLVEKGFDPGRRMASLALLAALAGALPAKAQACQGLVELFGAGAAKSRAFESMPKGIAEQAAANAEALLLEELALATQAVGSGSKRI